MTNRGKTAWQIALRLNPDPKMSTRSQAALMMLHRLLRIRERTLAMLIQSSTITRIDEFPLTPASNQVIQGQLHKTSQFWDTSKTAWSQSPRSRMDCIMHGAIQTAFRKSCGHFAIHQQSVNPVAIPWNLTISIQSGIALRLQIAVPSQPSCHGWRGLQENCSS